MGNVIREIEYKGFDGLWKFKTTEDTIEVEKDEERRVYDLTDIIKVEHDTDIVTLQIFGGGFYQVKFEENSFLVIDEFDKDSDFVNSIGSHVFGEEE